MQLMHHDHMELLPNTYPRYGASQLKMQEEQLRLQHKHLFKLGSNIIMQLWHQQLHAKIPMYTGLLLYGYILTEFRQPLQVQSHLEMPGILVQLGHTQRT